MSNFYDNLNVNGDISIRNSTTGNTFYINQLGSGNAVLIEDSTSPDLTPFIINSSGNVNIGRVNYLTTSGGSSAKLQVNNSTSTIPDNGGLPFDTNFIVQGFNQNSVGLFTTDINYSQIYFGTPANTFASNLRWDYTTSVLSLSTQDSGGTISINSGLNNESIKILQNGNVGVGISAPSEKLEVSGNTKISGSLNIGTILSGTPLINLGLDSSGNVVSASTGMTDSYTTTAYTVGNEIRFDNNIQGSNLYNVDLTDMLNNITIGANFGNVYFVAPSGDDSNGVRGDILNPFKTITGARDKIIDDVTSSAVTGSTLIYIFPGTYTDEEIQYQDGNFYFSAGARIEPPRRIHGGSGTATITNVNQALSAFTINGIWENELPPNFKFRVIGSTGNDGVYTVISATTLTGSTLITVLESIPSAIANGRLSTQMPIFIIDDTPLNANPLSQSNNCKVFGDGQFFIDKTLDDNWSGGFADCYGGIFYAEVDEIQLIKGVAVGVYNDAVTSFRGNFISVIEGGYVCTARDSSDSTFEFERINVETGGWTFIIRAGNTPNFNGNCTVIADRISVGNGWQAIALQNMNGGNVTVNCPQIISTNSYVVNILNMTGGNFNINGDLISTSTGGGIINQGSTNGKFYLRGNILNNTGVAYLSNNTCNVGNEVYLDGDIIIKSGSTQAITLNRGKLRLNGSIYNKDISGTGTTFNGINMTSNNVNYRLIIDNCKIITDNLSITQTSINKNIKVIHSLASNKPMNANITNVITGSNIIIDSEVE